MTVKEEWKRESDFRSRKKKVQSRNDEREKVVEKRKGSKKEV